MPANLGTESVTVQHPLTRYAGQGFGKIFSLCILEAKPLPDFSGTAPYQVCLKLDGIIQDPAFIKFLEKVGAEAARSFYVDDLLVLNLLRQEKPVPDSLVRRLQTLREPATPLVSSVHQGGCFFAGILFFACFVCFAVPPSALNFQSSASLTHACQPWN